MTVTEFNVGKYCLSEDECIRQGVNFAAYERGVADAAKAFAINRRTPVEAAGPAQAQMPVALADYTQSQVDALSHHEIADRLRAYTHPLLKTAADSIDYLAAQEGLLEAAQQDAIQAREALASAKQPLDREMSRLNRTVMALTAENDALRAALAAPQPSGSELDAAADTKRLDWIEAVIKEKAAVWLLPCGEELRFVQVRHAGDCENYPTEKGLRAAIDAAQGAKP